MLIWAIPIEILLCTPQDKITNTHQGYGFVEFKNEEDADYAIKIMNMIRLFGKPIRCGLNKEKAQSLERKEQPAKRKTRKRGTTD